MGDHPAASQTSGAQISMEDKQRDRASRNLARCAVIIVFAEVDSVHFITLHTFQTSDKKKKNNMGLRLGLLVA